MIVVNGTEYAAWDDVPPEVRALLRAFPDVDGDGTPDIVQNDASLVDVGTLTSETVVTTVTALVGDLSQFSPAERAEIEALFGDASGDPKTVFLGGSVPSRAAAPQDAAPHDAPPAGASPQDSPWRGSGPQDATPQDR
jgi:hypothetical protein